MITTPFVHETVGRGFSRLKVKVYRVEVHFRETDRDIVLTYADRERALDVADRIARRVFAKLRAREDAVEVHFEKDEPGNFKIVWDKKTTHNGQPGFFIAMKDYIFVRDMVYSRTILT